MTATQSLQQSQTSGVLKAVLQAGTLVCLLVAGGTTLKYKLMGGENPARLLNFAASGIFGEAAYSEGSTMIVVGILLHVAVSVVWSLLFILLSSQLRKISKYWWLLGAMYGIVIWAGMVFFVIPLSRIGFLGFDIVNVVTDIVNLTLCAGLPIAYVAAKQGFLR
ncbi:MAG: hypothetical protein L0Y80_11955 [Ignavibacteriae bacterium]|nr:hypothetical protein [Ignavibacteriota bacterium]